jgi:hypothetical protein
MVQCPPGRRLNTPELNIENLELLIIFVAPGFISLKVWGLLNSSPRFRLSESLVEAVIYSSWNAVFFVWLYDILKGINTMFAFGVVCMGLPILWPVLAYNLSKIRYFKTRLTPTAWDHFFNLKEDCFMILHLKNGQLLGGMYTEKSFASAYPEKEDLYLSELWRLDEAGEFLGPVENSGGLLVNFEEVSFIEILNLNYDPVDTVNLDQTVEK